MPTDLLLPAFALTLLANAALVAVAIRWLLRARDERDRPKPADRGRLETTTEPIDPPTRPVGKPPAPEPSRIDPPPAAGPTKPPRPTRAAAPGTAKKPAAAKPGAPKPVPTKPARPTKQALATDRDRPRSEPRRGGRRRFSLPPLDDDHERVSRSIETFLSGSESADAVDGASAGAGSPTVATTVATVAIHGLHPRAAGADRQAVDDVVATVERTLHAAARSADQVTAVGAGRFRVVLAGTGELAARAYLRRVRATVGPSLEAADAPLVLVTATATVLDDPVQVAIAQAEARLDTALAGAARRASGDEPRVAPR
jgi:hypothetical protein